MEMPRNTSAARFQIRDEGERGATISYTDLMKAFGSARDQQDAAVHRADHRAAPRPAARVRHAPSKRPRSAAIAATRKSNSTRTLGVRRRSRCTVSHSVSVGSRGIGR